MILVVGGAGQGKLAWTLKQSGLEIKDASSRPEDAAPILTELEELIREQLAAGEDPQKLLPTLRKKEYVLCREVGCGVVPLDPADRRWREETGRLCCALAQEAAGVVRLCCGIPQVLKEFPGAEGGES